MVIELSGVAADVTPPQQRISNTKPNVSPQRYKDRSNEDRELRIEDRDLLSSIFDLAISASSASLQCVCLTEQIGSCQIDDLIAATVRHRLQHTSSNVHVCVSQNYFFFASDRR